jgi:hypothetical protein
VSVPHAPSTRNSELSERSRYRRVATGRFARSVGIPPASAGGVLAASFNE